MKVYQSELATMGTPLIVGFDVEWTKNYQMRNANKAFCFSLVRVSMNSPCDVNAIEHQLLFDFVLGYSESEAECQQLCQVADHNISRILSPHNIIVGHQFSSDVSVLLACSDCSLPSIEELQHAWRTRHHHSEERAVGVFDTRYDLPTSKHSASNKLVHVCPEWNLIVTQPEIKGSMTKMQREFYLKRQLLTLEKIAVLNLRHSLSSILLYLFQSLGYPKSAVNVNAILYRNLREHFAYVRSESFVSLLGEQAAASLMPGPYKDVVVGG